MAEVLICASCPEPRQAEVEAICLDRGIIKTFGRAGDMMSKLSGSSAEWLGKWEAKVVMGTVAAARVKGATRAKLLCIAGGKFCDQEMAQQPRLVRLIKEEMRDPAFLVKVEWMEMAQFRDEYGARARAGAGRAAEPRSSGGAGSGPGNPKLAAEPAPAPRPSGNSGGGSGGNSGGGGASKAKPTCRVCAREFESGRALEQHQADAGHGPGGGGGGGASKAKPTCRVCAREFESGRALEQHQADAGHGPGGGGGGRSAQVEMYVCAECERTFSTEKGLLQHQSATGHKDPCCAECGKQFSSPAALAQHARDTAHRASEPQRRGGATPSASEADLADAMRRAAFAQTEASSSQPLVEQGRFVLLRDLVGAGAPLNGMAAMCVGRDDERGRWIVQPMELVMLFDEVERECVSVKPKNVLPLRWQADLSSSGLQLGEARTLVARRVVQMQLSRGDDASIRILVGVVHAVKYALDGGEIVVVQCMGDGQIVRANRAQVHCLRRLTLST